ncbi:MAG: nucleoside recognition domain-containing protein [Huintestinicola sp.]
MINAVYMFLIVSSVIAAVYSGNTNELSESMLNEPVNAVELAIYLCGGMCFWCGIMRVAEKSGITDRIAKLFGFFLSGLFSDIDKNGHAFKTICMNLTANMLGLGNAATPLGIEAMKALAAEEKTTDTASPSMIIFTVLNTASITLIPSTAASLRLKYGSEAPFDILPAVWLTSAAALAVSLTAAIVPMLHRKRGKK